MIEVVEISRKSIIGTCAVLHTVSINIGKKKNAGT
jgi:hypothetical protein